MDDEEFTRDISLAPSVNELCSQDIEIPPTSYSSQHGEADSVEDIEDTRTTTDGNDLHCVEYDPSNIREERKQVLNVKFKPEPYRSHAFNPEKKSRKYDSNPDKSDAPNDIKNDSDEVFRSDLICRDDELYSGIMSDQVNLPSEGFSFQLNIVPPPSIAYTSRKGKTI